MLRVSDELSILEEPQFTRQDVLNVTGLTTKALQHTLDRNLVVLNSDHNPGTGRRRMFCGSDVLKLATAHSMSGIGFPLRWAYLVANEIATRAENRLLKLPDSTPGLAIATYPVESGDWARVPLWSGMKEEPKLPVAVQVIEVDRLIDEVIAKLQALVADEPLPDFDVPEPVVEPSPWSPENDFFRKWTKNSAGENVYVGLTFAETLELQEMEAKLGGDDRNSSRDRYLELWGRHEEARLKRLGAEMLAADRARNPHDA